MPGCVELETKGRCGPDEHDGHLNHADDRHQQPFARQEFEHAEGRTHEPLEGLILFLLEQGEQDKAAALLTLRLIGGKLNLESLGVEVVFHKISQRPGKPMWFGMGPGGQAVFALPGNPVSAMVCGEIFLRPALEAGRTLITYRYD